MHTRETAPDSPSPSPTVLDTIGDSAPRAQPDGGRGAPGLDASSALPARERRLADLLRMIFALPAGGTGLLGLSRILERAAEQAGLVELQTTARLLATRLQSQVSVESDRARVRALAGAKPAKAFLDFTTNDNPLGSGTPIGVALAGVLLYAVEHQLPLHGYGHQLGSLLAPSKPLASRLERAIRGTAQELLEFAIAPDVPGDWRKLASLFHKARTWAPGTAPPRAPIPPSRPPRRDHRTALQMKVLRAAYSPLFEAAGVVSPRNSLTPAQFEHLARVLHAALNSGFEQTVEIAHSIHLTMILGLRPSQFAQVLLFRERGALWIDVDKGAVCYSLADVVADDCLSTEPGSEAAVVCVPLDSVTTDWLKSRRAARPEARCLNELFDMQRQGWALGLKRFLRSTSLTAQRVTLTRLIVGAPRIAISECGIDPLYADAAFMVGGVIPRANYHYVLLYKSKIAAAARAFYRHMGLSGQLSWEPRHDASLYTPPDVADARAFVVDGLKCVRTVVQLLQRPRVVIKEAIDALNAASLWLLAVLVFFVGHRGQMLEHISRASICLGQGVCFVADKFEEAVRPVPITKLLADYVHAYLGIIGSVANRLESSDTALAQALRERTLPECDKPLFFRLADRRLQPLTSEFLRVQFDKFRLRLNDGRRFLSMLLQDAGLSVVIENKVAGRNAPSAAPYPYWSALAPYTVLAAVRSELQLQTSRWNLPAAWVLDPRRAARPAAPAENYHVIESLGTPVWRDELSDVHAFTVLDGYHLERYHTCRRRFEARAFPDPPINLAFLLVFSGVFHKAVLESALREAVARRFHEHGEQLALWASTAELGERRVVVPRYWKHLIHRLPDELEGDIWARLDTAAASLLRTSRTLAFHALLNAARCAHALYLPPLLREFANGRLAPSVGKSACKA